MHSKRRLCSWPSRCSGPGALLRLGSEPGVTGTRTFRSAPTSSAKGKEVHCHTLLFLSLKSPFPSGRLDPSGYFSYATPATSPLFNLLYTLTSSSTTHVSYAEVSTTHAHQASRCPSTVLDWLTAVFSAPTFSRFRGKPKKSLAWRWCFHLNGHEIPLWVAISSFFLCLPSPPPPNAICLGHGLDASCGMDCNICLLSPEPFTFKVIFYSTQMVK